MLPYLRGLGDDIPDASKLASYRTQSLPRAGSGRNEGPLATRARVVCGPLPLPSGTKLPRPFAFRATQDDVVKLWNAVKSQPKISEE